MENQDNNTPVWKHSSGDLHSRLKTRKILGVGETDNGDIHRSKISQVLGHNEHLYVRLPRGFWTFHVLLGVGVTLEALLLLFSPAMAASMGLLPFPTEIHTDALLAARLLGAALAGMAVFMWSLLGTSDKHYARTLLLSLLTYQVLAVIVAGCSGAYNGVLLERRTLMSVGVRIGVGLLSLLYFYKIGEPTSGLRKSASYKDLTKEELQNAKTESKKEA
ncbi:tumor protein p53-inducible protein 11-like isoform X1 [Oratosquilla oratoria]|uniref:tumor protein p53-inducible protein 11-like isoform X1 n=1 Tax=Oratosquilla oratoria TaxID=337810 RepID=UPI003F7779B1